MSQLRIGLICLLFGILLTRIAIYLSHPLPNMPPDQIWHGMNGGLKMLVIASFCLSAYGVGKSLDAIVRRLRR